MRSVRASVGEAGGQREAEEDRTYAALANSAQRGQRREDEEGKGHSSVGAFHISSHEIEMECPHGTMTGKCPCNKSNFIEKNSSMIMTQNDSKTLGHFCRENAFGAVGKEQRSTMILGIIIFDMNDANHS